MAKNNTRSPLSSLKKKHHYIQKSPTEKQEAIHIGDFYLS